MKKSNFEEVSVFDSVEDLVLSQEIAKLFVGLRKKTGIFKMRVHRIIKRDIKLQCLGREKHPI